VGEVMDAINANKEVLDEKKRQLEGQKRMNKEEEARTQLNGPTRETVSISRTRSCFKRSRGCRPKKPSSTLTPLSSKTSSS